MHEVMVWRLKKSSTVRSLSSVMTAGSAAAQRLAESGIDVLVLERRTVVGNPAQCGECIPNWGEVVGTFHHLDDHEWLKTYFEFPERVRLHRLDNMRVFLPSGKSFDFELDAFAGHRLQFDGYLADKAVRAGAEIRVSTPLKRIQHQRKANRELLVTSEGRYTCDFLIDASGSLAHVGRLRHGKTLPIVQRTKSRRCTLRFVGTSQRPLMSSWVRWLHRGTPGSFQKAQTRPTLDWACVRGNSRVR